jgi:hypothetical protein
MYYVSPYYHLFIEKNYDSKLRQIEIEIIDFNQNVLFSSQVDKEKEKLRKSSYSSSSQISHALPDFPMISKFIFNKVRTYVCRLRTYVCSTYLCVSYCV